MTTLSTIVVAVELVIVTILLEGVLVVVVNSYQLEVAIHCFL